MRFAPRVPNHNYVAGTRTVIHLRHNYVAGTRTVIHLRHNNVADAALSSTLMWTVHSDLRINVAGTLSPP